DLLAVAHGDQRTDREADRHRVVGVRDLHFLARLVHQLHLRTRALARRGAALGVDDDQRRQAGDLVDLAGDGDALLDVLEADRARVLGDDRTGERIPRGDLRSRLDRLAVADHQHRAVRHLVALAFAAAVVGDRDLARARDDDLVALRVRDVAHLAREAHDTVGLRLDRARDGSTRRRAPDVEGAHRQLRARLADRLRGDDADGLAGVHQRAAPEVASVALRTQAVARLAGERRAHAHFVNPDALDLLDRVLVEQRAGLEGRLLRLGMHDVGGRHAAEDAIAQRLDDLAALDQRLHRHALRRPAVVLGDDEVLRDVDEPAREVARVRGLQRGVGQALAGAVRRDEVLQDVQALAKVRGDRRLDDRAVGLGHQAPHARQLADLRGRAARTRVGHHVDRVERLLAHRLAGAVDDLLRLELAHHRLADVVARAAPDVDHLVVALALRDQARRVLLLDLLHLALGLRQDLGLLRRHEHVVDRDRDAGTRGQAEARLHQLVGE